MHLKSKLLKAQCMNDSVPGAKVNKKNEFQAQKFSYQSLRLKPSKKHFYTRFTLPRTSLKSC